jgi:hypothetical protein
VETVYLSKRNLLTLLSKLDRNKSGEDDFSTCTIIKNDNVHKTYPQTMESIAVVAHEDGEEPTLYYWSEIYLKIPRSKLQELLTYVSDGSTLGSMKINKIKVFAVADEMYYTERDAGKVLSADEPRK